MNHEQFTAMISSLFRVTCLALAIAATSVCAAPVEYAGRGIYHFASASGCPFAGSAAETDCNRVALDVADIHVRIDPGNHTIVFSGKANHSSSDVLGDVLLQGSGVDADGQRVPLSAHLILRRSGMKWHRDVYAHVPVQGRFTNVQIDPYRIRVREGKNESDVLTPDEARALFERPSFAAQLGWYFVQVRATDLHRPSADDITIGLGVGRLSSPVARASFTSSAPTGTDLAHMLAGSTWAIQFDVLSDHIPVWAAQRELFLFGLDGSPLVHDMLVHGFRKHDQLEIGARNGHGYLRVNGHEQPFTGSAASARAFMQESFIGLILGWHHHDAA
jgi:hypothetical protein